MTEQTADQQTLSLRTPPHSIDAEQSVLGGLLLDNRAWESVSEVLEDTDFYSHKHRNIYRAIKSLVDQEQPIDVVTVSEELDELGTLDEVGGIAYLGELADMTPSTANSGAYGVIVKERSQQRRLIEAAADISLSAYEPEGKNSLDILSDAEQKIAQIAEGNRKEGGPVVVGPILKNTLDQLDELFNKPEGLSGLTTGFTEIDNRTSGFQKADMIVVAGRPSMGKTTYAMNLVENALVATKRPCLVFSMEMPSESIVMRMLSSIGKIDQTRIRSGKLIEDDWPRLSSAVNILKDLPLYIDDTPALTPQDMRARCRKVYRENDNDLALVMVDYMQLMQVSGPSEGRSQEISEISRSMKAIAKEFGCPIIALSQLNRSLEQRPNKRPVMSDLRESGAIEQDADIIAFIYRDEVYNEDTPDKGIAEIITGKHRNGPIGTDRLAFVGKYTRFENLAAGYEGNWDDDE
ncbi:MAG TPA: replicative DNA helicase [Oceanospirillales bacterium]|nr:replicative DNA helicase [Oceanospirillales bacterium]|tara:strand:- start:5631 stop:7019 length:1389 start_codon:yes stop_codon:yes gene_type:complete